MAVYTVGAGQTYATFQLAADQLWADVGGANFTEEHEIRAYDGTYTEAVTLNSGLRPMPRYKLKINAASGETAVILTNTGLSSSALHCGNVDNIVVSGIAIRNYYTGGNYCIKSLGGGNLLDDCAFEGYSAERAIHNVAYARDCTFSGFSIPVYGAAGVFEECLFSGGYLYTYPATGIPLSLRGCRFNGSFVLVSATNVYPAFGIAVELLNCAFYSVARALGAQGADRFDCRVIDCIFDTITTAVFDVDAGTGRIVSDHNIFNNVTKVGRANSTDYTSLSDWQAFADEDGVSPDAHSLEADPLLTDPGNDDFSLGAASPARHAGQGSGVVTGYNDVAFDRFHPDIGAWSSGALTVTAPSITAAVDDESGTTATLTLNADNALDVLTVLYRKTPGTAEWTTFGSTRTGDGDLQVTGLVVSGYEFIAYATRGGVTSLPSDPAFVKVSAGTMTLKKAFWRLLLSLSDVTDLVGDRITAVPASQTVALPYITYTVVSDVDTHHMEGASGFAEARIQVDSYGATYEDADAVAKALRENLDGYDSTVTFGTDSNKMQVRLTSSQDGPYDPDPGAEIGPFRVSQDYWVQHEKTVPSP